MTIKKSLHARHLMEMMVYDLDAICQARWSLSSFVEKLAEAWSSDKKDEVINQGKKRNLRLVDHAIIGDYDLCLWQEKDADHYVSINNAQHSPLSPEAQQGKFASRYLTFPTNMIKEILSKWTRTYGVLIIGSCIESRNRSYYKMAKRMFPDRKIEPYNDDFKYGFKLFPG